MKDSVAPGLSFTRRLTVDEGRTIGFMGEALRVYATPAMVLDAEQACRDVLLAHLDPGEDSVGVHVSADHLGGTPLGAWVEVAVRVAAVDRRRVGFEWETRDALEVVGRGRHDRFVVDVARYRQRLEDKLARLAEAAKG